MKLKFFLCTMILLLTTACHKPAYNQNELLEHPEILKSALQSCQQIDAEGTTSYCRMVYRASDQMRQNLFLAQNREVFGETILRLQMSVASLQSQLHNNNDSEKNQENLMLKQKIEEQSAKIRQYLLILRLIGI